MAKPDSPIADCDNGGVQPHAHDDDILVSFTDPAKKDKPRNYTIQDDADLRAEFQALDDEAETARQAFDAALKKATETRDAAIADVEKRRGPVNTKAFNKARKALGKIERDAAKAAAAAKADPDTED